MACTHLDKKSGQLTIADRCALVLTLFIFQSKAYIHDLLLVMGPKLYLARSSRYRATKSKTTPPYFTPPDQGNSCQFRHQT